MKTNQKIQYLREELRTLIGALYWAQTEREASNIVDRLKRIVEVCENTDMCSDSCKGMYFCTKMKGHEGPHTDDWGLSWSD